MHAVIRQDCLADPHRQDEVAQRLGEGLLPALHQATGCVATYVVTAPDGSVVCLSLHVDPEAVGTATVQLAARVDHHLAELVLALAQVVVGPVWSAPLAAEWGVDP